MYYFERQNELLKIGSTFFFVLLHLHSFQWLLFFYLLIFLLLTDYKNRSRVVILRVIIYNWEHNMDKKRISKKKKKRSEGTGRTYLMTSIDKVTGIKYGRLEGGFRPL